MVMRNVPLKSAFIIHSGGRPSQLVEQESELGRSKNKETDHPAFLAFGPKIRVWGFLKADVGDRQLRRLCEVHEITHSRFNEKAALTTLYLRSPPTPAAS